MAFIPDEAIDNCHELSGSGFTIYAYICRRRNHQRQSAWLTVEQIAIALSISKTTVYAATAELEKKGWLECTENNWIPLKGDFHPVDRKYHVRPTA